jgi:hypothetical protein
MRARKLFVTGSMAVAMAALAGCGSTTETPGGNVDSGTVTDGTAPTGDSSFADATSDSGDAGVTDGCVFGDASILTSNPADAALNDSGASVGTCLSCVQTSCKGAANACDEDACCESTFDCLFNCLGGVGGSLINCYTFCGGSLNTSNADAPELLLAQCAFKSCPTECAACSIPKLCPTDAGPTPPADSGSDASEDASTDASDSGAGDAAGD